MRCASILLALFLASGAHATTYYVAPPPAGNDAFPGTFALPWATLQHAGSSVVPGDVVEVRAGSYAGMNLGRSGAAGLPITFRPYAAEIAIVSSAAPGTTVGFNAEFRSHFVIERFIVAGVGTYGIRVVGGSNVVLRGNRISAASTSAILAALVDDVVIEDNVLTGSVNDVGLLGLGHGARWTIRANALVDNHGGMRFLGDPNEGGPGLFTDLVLDANRIRVRNDATGAVGIAFFGVQDSSVTNNLVWNVPRFGIVLAKDVSPVPSSDNTFLHNTVVLLPTARWAFFAQEGATGTLLRNNILLKPEAVGDSGAVQLSADSLGGLSSDRNVVSDRFSIDGGAPAYYTLAGWRVETGQDAASIVDDASMFASAAGEDFRLVPSASAVDAGQARPDVARDFEGTPRPQGAGWDIGADEYAEPVFANGFE